MIADLIKLFLDSRRRGVTGARKKCAASTLKIYEDNLKLFHTFLQSSVDGGGVEQYQNIKRMHIVQFLDVLDKKLWSKSSYLQVLRTMKAFFRWVDQDEECQEAGLKGFQRYLPPIEKNPRRTDIPQMKDLTKFKQGFNTNNRWGYRDYVATCLMMDTGIRLGEVCNLRVDSVLLDDQLMLVSGKTGPRPIPITKEMAGLLKGWMKRRITCKTADDSPYVFVSKYRPKMAVNAFGQRFRKHRTKLGLPRISAHSVRHSFCTNYLRQGGDIEKLRMMTGHTSFEMLSGYVHLAKIGGKSMQEELERVSLLKVV